MDTFFKLSFTEKTPKKTSNTNTPPVVMTSRTIQSSNDISLSMFSIMNFPRNGHCGHCGK